ncbi:hypothetical protein F511_15176 [Dorcoceras hygrometricum]|uniref:Uncharacterized protein n=1 Tax=Dorcoceras hygrometricum TaxID=472368 RepID=A0A2Z7CDG4_9LAMI|nr:hypothetical protein F511_15176 [Dorcoceras hygrometricum]
MGSELIRAESGFEDLNTSVDRNLAYFRTRYFLSPSLIPSKPLRFTENYFSDLPSISAVVLEQDLSSQTVPAVFVETSKEADLSRLWLSCPGEIC